MISCRSCTIYWQSSTNESIPSTRPENPSERLECACYFAQPALNLEPSRDFEVCLRGSSGRIALKHTSKTPHFAGPVILITKSERTRDGDKMVRAPRANTTVCHCRFSFISRVAHFQAEFIFNLYRDFAVVNIIR
jgi:hypothetical protein